MEALAQNVEFISENQTDFTDLLPLHYSFEYGGMPFDCTLVNNDDGCSFILDLTARLGYMPYSAEDKSRRNMIRSGLGPLMAQGKVSVDRQSNLTYSLKTIVSEKLCTRVLMESILFTLLDAKQTLSDIQCGLNPSQFTEDQTKTA